jgi:hypothetical protein
MLEKYIVFYYLKRLGFVVVRTPSSTIPPAVDTTNIVAASNETIPTPTPQPSKQETNTHLYRESEEKKKCRGWYPPFESQHTKCKEEECAIEIVPAVRRKIFSYSQLKSFKLSPTDEVDSKDADDCMLIEHDKKEEDSVMEEALLDEESGLFVAYDVHNAQGYKKSAPTAPSWRVCVCAEMNNSVPLSVLHKLHSKCFQ